jgi:hypothetical protein
MTRTSDLLLAVRRLIQRYVVLSEYQATAVVLWVAHTHALDAAEVSPYLAITSPEKRSGKTRLLEVLELVVARPWRIITPSEAVLYRKVAAVRPTVLLDEADAVFYEKGPRYEGLRALLNAGHRRGAVVSRCVGDGPKQRLEDFPVFCPKALAGIGDLPDTVADRSIPIRLARRAPAEKVERFRYRDAAQAGVALQQALGEELASYLETLQESRPEIPAILNDRAAECWEPLMALAVLAGGTWPQAARQAAIALHAAAMQDQTLGIQLLAAIRDTFAEHAEDRLSTAALLQALVNRDDGPWAEWWGRAVAAGDSKGPGHRLSRLLRPFNIGPRKIRIGADTMRGFLRSDFEDAFTRYLPSLPEGGENGTTAQPASIAAAIDAARSDVPFHPPLQEDGGEGFDGVVARAKELFTGEVSATVGVGWSDTEEDEA